MKDFIASLRAFCVLSYTVNSLSHRTESSSQGRYNIEEVFSENSALQRNGTSEAERDRDGEWKRGSCPQLQPDLIIREDNF